MNINELITFGLERFFFIRICDDYGNGIDIYYYPDLRKLKGDDKYKYCSLCDTITEVVENTNEALLFYDEDEWKSE